MGVEVFTKGNEIGVELRTSGRRGSVWMGAGIEVPASRSMEAHLVALVATMGRFVWKAICTSAERSQATLTEVDVPKAIVPGIYAARPKR